MKIISILIVSLLMMKMTSLYSQNIELDMKNMKAINVYTSLQNLDGDNVIRIVKDSLTEEFDEPSGLATFFRTK